MIQLLGLRKWVPQGETDEKIYDAFHKKNWRAKSIPDLFKNLDHYLKVIPSAERWNMFYTVAKCGDGKREFQTQTTIVFDVDGIDLKRADKYIDVTLKALKLPPKSVAIVCSGNGLHFIIETKNEIADKKYFDTYRGHYKACLDHLNYQLKKANLPGAFDPKVWDARRILRLPGTVNRKPNKRDTKAYFIQHKIEPVDFDIVAFSGLPAVAMDDQVDKDYLRKYPRIDDETVIKECLFMAHVATLGSDRTCSNGEQLTEPEWYAWMSIAGKFENGANYVHKVSAQYDGYSQVETEQKLDQAIAASGPRTCNNIHTEWGSSSQCTQCEHHGQILSPINIVGDSHIKTEFTGYHTAVPGKKPVPHYEDLRRAFERDFNYKGLDGSRMIMVWMGTHYMYMPNPMIEEYAQERFNPKAKSNMCREFRELLQRTNIRAMDWWDSTTTGAMNFENGVLILKTMQLEDHSPDKGFRHVLPYKYDVDAAAPIFENMLQRITCGDNEMISVLLEFMGYSLSNDTCWAQKALVLVGIGANGKSTFMNVLKELAGKGNYGSATMADLRKSEYSRQLLDGKLFNISEETPTTAMMDSNLFKTMVTGGELQVRSPYKEPYYAENKAKLIFSCNDLPDAYDNSFGYYRRFLMAEFKALFLPGDKNYDPHMDKKLKGELSGIFNLAIAGYARMADAQKFSKSEQIEKTTDTYRNETDTVKAWLMENVLVNGDDTQFAALKDLYVNYKCDAEGAGEKPLTRAKFTRKLRGLITDFKGRYGVVRGGSESQPERGLRGVIFGAGVGITEGATH